MFATTTVKLRISPFVVSQATTAGLSESACTSVLTTASLASSGGIVIGSPVPPSDAGGARAVAVGAVDAVGAAPAAGAMRMRSTLRRRPSQQHGDNDPQAYTGSLTQLSAETNRLWSCEAHSPAVRHPFSESAYFLKPDVQLRITVSAGCVG